MNFSFNDLVCIHVQIEMLKDRFGKGFTNMGKNQDGRHTYVKVTRCKNKCEQSE